jgi:hypothetical protein
MLTATLSLSKICSHAITAEVEEVDKAATKSIGSFARSDIKQDELGTHHRNKLFDGRRTKTADICAERYGIRNARHASSRGAMYPGVQFVGERSI